MNFKGASQPLGPDDFSACLKVIPGVEEAALRSVIDTETAGSGFDHAGRPAVLFERHLFWAELGPGAKRATAAAQNLAYPTWGTLPYPKSSDGVYAEIRAACLIDENAALRSTSWGLGQILGRECLEAGFQTAKAMVLAFMDGEGAQLQGMVKLIKARKLDIALVSHDWETFARSYNGSGFRKNHYDTKLADAYLRWTRRLAAGPAPVAPVADERLRVVQGSLKQLGLYEGQLDGLNGPLTQAALSRFQAGQPHLAVTGKADQQTEAALTAAVFKPAPVAPPEKPQDAPLAGGTTISHSAGTGLATGGLGAVIGATQDPSHWWVWAIAAAVLAFIVIETLRHSQKKA